MPKVNKKSILTTMLLSLIPFCSTWAQNVAKWDNTLRSNGKIYVVVGVVAIIFFGLAVYLIMQERRISKIENQLKNKKP